MLVLNVISFDFKIRHSLQEKQLGQNKHSEYNLLHFFQTGLGRGFVLGFRLMIEEETENNANVYQVFCR